MKKIVFSEVEKEELEILKKKIRGNKVVGTEKEIDEKTANKYKDAEVLGVFVNSEINGRILDKMPKLKFISVMSTGYNNIDLKECKKRGIKVSNVPTYGENTVAEHTFGLILTLSRKIHDSIRRTRTNNFSIEGLEGFDLKDKTIGVVGTGSIGAHVIRIAKGFEMNVIAYDVHKKEGLARKLGFKYVGLNSLVKKSDIISLHVPLCKGTHHLINTGKVRKMKRGVYLINTARGEILDTCSLLFGLDKGIIAGAGLDVIEGEAEIKEEKELLKKKLTKEEREELRRNHLLLRKKNVVITPHNAFNSKEAVMRILDTTGDNVQGFLRGKIVNRVC